MSTLPSFKFFTIDSYTVDLAKTFGIYVPAEDDLGAIAEDLLDQLMAQPGVKFPVPNMSGLTVWSSEVDGGLCLSVEKTHDANGKTLDCPIEVSTTALALDAASAEQAAAIGLDWLIRNDPVGINPGFKALLEDGPDAPFTVVMPNIHAEDYIAADLLNPEEMIAASGFIQVILGNALARTELQPHTDMEYLAEIIVSEEQKDDVRMDHMLQTGGEPVGQLIVKPGKQGCPEVYAFISDAEQDIFKISFAGDETCDLTLDGLTYAKLDADTLADIQDLLEDAEYLWEEIFAASDAFEADNDGRSGFERHEGEIDPFVRLYTWHPIHIVPAEAGKKIGNLLGIGQRYENGEAVKDEAARNDAETTPAA